VKEWYTRERMLSSGRVGLVSLDGSRVSVNFQIGACLQGEGGLETGVTGEETDLFRRRMPALIGSGTCLSKGTP